MGEHNDLLLWIVWGGLVILCFMLGHEFAKVDKRLDRMEERLEAISENRSEMQ